MTSISAKYRFGSYIAEIVHAYGLSVDLKIPGLDPKVCGEVGSQETLMAFGGVSEQALCDLVSGGRINDY